MKRTADKISDLELPEGSRPMLALDWTRRRLANSQQNLVQQPLNGNASQTATISPQAAVPQATVPSQVTVPPSATVPSPATVPHPTSSEPHRPDSTVAPAQPTAFPSALDSSSPVEQTTLQEILEKGQSEGRQEIQAKLEKAEAELQELRRQLDPAKFKAEYDRGFREGSKKVYNTCSHHYEAKASEDRLAFQKICEEKDMAIRDQQLIMSNYQKELMARRRRIADLEQHANQQLGQNISGQQILDAEARFNAQAQELAVEKSQRQLMSADLGNWQVRCSTISADLEKWKAAFDLKASQLDVYQRQQDNSALELQESGDRAKELAAINSEILGSVEASNEELKLKLKKLSSDYDSLKESNIRLTKDATESSAEIKSLKALSEGQSTELAKVRGGLEETAAQQDKELQELSAENEELARKLREREEEGQRVTQNPDKTPQKADEEQAEEIDDLPAEYLPETAAANLELVRVMVERERENTAAENARREQRVMATLERMQETEQRRRQVLINELEAMDAQLYDARTQITELTERLRPTSPTQPLQSLPSAPSSQSLPQASPSPSQPSPIPTQPPAAAAAPSPPSHQRSRFRLVTVAETIFSPRRLVILLSIFLIAFLSFYLPSANQAANRLSATEDNNSGEVAVRVLPLPADPVVTRTEAEEERRRVIHLWAMRNWEWNEMMSRGEEPHGRNEYRPILGLDF